VRAVRIHEHGGPEKLRCERVDEPLLKSPREAIVEIKAAALSALDLASREGRAGPGPLPRTLGADGAGVVVAVGEQVASPRCGEAVCVYPLIGCGRCELCEEGRDFLCGQAALLGAQRDGTCAEYVSVPAENCLPVPPGLSFAEAAAMPSSFATAYRILVEEVELKPGEHVLIAGIGEGASVAVMQLANRMGAHVWVMSDSEEKLEIARRWGADHTLLERDQDLSAEVRRLTGKRGVDVVVHCAGAERLASSLAALAKGGRLALAEGGAEVAEPMSVRRIFWNQLKISGCTFGSRRDLRELLRFAASAGLKPLIEEVFPLEEAPRAQRLLETGRTFGKLVLQVGD
jgi:NADPH:quinone reductase-like Zn-dependent oxidoreductase